MADQRVQAVVVATPPDSHLELTLAALEAGKHVMVEKPAFLRAAGLRRGAAAEARSGRRLMVAENYCYKPLARVLREVIASGALGEVRFFHLVAVKSQRRAGWRDDPAIAGGGALFEGGVHWIDLLANVGLEVESARGLPAGRGGGLERSMLVVVEYREGGVGTLAHSWEVPSPLHGLRDLPDLRHQGLGGVRVERHLRRGDRRPAPAGVSRASATSTATGRCGPTSWT